MSARTPLPAPVAGQLVAGIGFRRATGAEEIVALVRRALVAAGRSEVNLAALATAADRAGDPAFLAAARALGATALGLPDAALRAVDARVPTRSARIERLRGVGSLAEAAALAVAGEGARLALARVAEAGATCALAITDDPSPANLPANVLVDVS